MAGASPPSTRRPPRHPPDNRPTPANRPAGARPGPPPRASCGPLPGPPPTRPADPFPDSCPRVLRTPSRASCGPLPGPCPRVLRTPAHASCGPLPGPCPRVLRTPGPRAKGSNIRGFDRADVAVAALVAFEWRPLPRVDDLGSPRSRQRSPRDPRESRGCAATAGLGAAGDRSADRIDGHRINRRRPAAGGGVPLAGRRSPMPGHAGGGREYGDPATVCPLPKHAVCHPIFPMILSRTTHGIVRI